MLDTRNLDTEKTKREAGEKKVFPSSLRMDLGYFEMQCADMETDVGV